MKHSDFPENSTEYYINNVYINAARFNWDAHTINLMILEIKIGLDGKERKRVDEIEKQIRYNFEKEFTESVYWVEGLGWITPNDVRLTPQQLREAIGSDGMSYSRYKTDNYTHPFFPNDEQDERRKLERKHARALEERSKMVNKHGLCMAARENRFHLLLLSNGWKYENTTENGVHRYSLADKIAAVSVTVVQSLQVLHANGRDSATYYIINSKLRRFLRLVTKQVEKG